MYRQRSYRQAIKSEDLVSFEVAEKETDLFISASKRLEGEARSAVLNYRREVEGYIKKYPFFRTSLEPVEIKYEAPEIIKSMASASRKAGVGPMAAIAGAMAEFVGRDLIKLSDQVIVENGGDIFLKTLKKRRLGIYAGDESPFTGKLAIEIEPNERGLGICASSGTVSHSLSLGASDAVIIISEDTALADAAATAVGNIVKNAAYINKGIDFAKSIKDIAGILILIGDKMGSWGKIKLA